MANDMVQPDYMGPEFVGRPNVDRFTTTTGTPRFTHEETTEYLNKILRGEISAVEAYQQVIEKFSADAESLQLSRFQNEHSRAVAKLKECIQNSLEVPSPDSGVWGTAVATIVGAAKLAGNKASLKSLLEGEEHGLKEYEEVLKMNLAPEERDLVERDLKPALKQHIAELKRMIEIQ